MADEETKNENEQTPEESPEEKTPDARAAAAGDADQGEKPSSKQLRKRARATAKTPARKPLTPEQRAEERKQARAASAKSRRRWRSKQREKSVAAGPATGTPPADRTAPERKARQGIVVSSKADKTITVRIDNVQRHRTYGKVLRHTNTLHAHDERNEAGEGDVVKVIECRPLSRTKRWRLIEVLEKAK